jgi:hypothetical protein
MTTPMPQDTPAEELDILAFEDADSADLRIKHPVTGAPTAMVVQIAGPEHPLRRRLVLDRQRRLRAHLAKTGNMHISDPEDDAADDLELTVACTLGWRGAAQPYTPAAARALYADPKRRWLRDQVQAGLQDRALFMRSSAPA